MDETPRPAEQPAARAQRLALEKAAAVADRRPECIVIGSDQVAAAGERILEKPLTAAACHAQLRVLSGSVATFHTACAVIGREAGIQLAHVDTTIVRVRHLDSAEIERYIEREQPLDCAGGFKAEGLGISLFESIESQDPTGLIGLPLIWLAHALRQAGYRVP